MNRIKELRKEKGWMQEDLGKLLGVQKSAVSKYENGKIPLTGETLIKLSEIFEVTTDYLLGQSDSPSLTQAEETELNEIDYALFGEVKELTEQNKRELLNIARYLRQNKNEP